MAGPIKREQVFNKNVFTDPDNEAKAFNDTLDVTEQKLKDIAEVREKKLKDFKIGDTKDIKKFNEALEDSKDAVEDLSELQKIRIEIQKELDKIEKKRIQTLAKLETSTTAEAIALTESNIRLQERNKSIKENVKDSLGLISAYSKESKRLNDLRNKYKDLAIQNKENTVEGKKLLKNIVLLDKKLKDLDDSVGQNFRSVGKYEKALKGLNSIIGKLGLLAVLTKGVELLTGAFGESRDGALGMQIALAHFTETAKVFVRNLIKAFSGVVIIFRAVGQSWDNIVDSISIKMGELLLSIAEVQLSIARWTGGMSEAEARVDLLKGTLDALLQKQIEAAKVNVTVAEGWDLITAAFKGGLETTKKAINGQTEFLRLQLKTRIEIEKQTRALAGLQEKRQILQDISDDDTIGFVTRAKAIGKAKIAAEDFAKKDIALAKIKEKLTFDAVKQDLRRENALTESQLARIKTSEQLELALTRRISFFRKLEEGETDVLVARKISDANDEAFSDAYVERREKETEAMSFRRDQEEKFRKTARDAFEQENDIFVEFTELRIAANETILNSDKATLKERQKALSENVKLERELFKNSMDLIIAQSRASIDELKKTIDLRKDLTKEQKTEQKLLLDKRKALISTASIREIINEQDIEQQGILIRNLDLGEIEEKVLKDTLKLKKDITEANKEALLVQEETATKTKELQGDIALQKSRLEDEIKQDRFEDLQTENLKTNLEIRIDALKENSIERLELEKELNELLIDESIKRAEAEADLRQEQIDLAVKLGNDAFDIFEANKAKEAAARSKAAADDIDRQEELIDRLRDNATTGTEEALAFQEAQLVKARLQKERDDEEAAKREAARAKAQIFLNQLVNSDKTGGEAIAEAFATTFAADIIAAGLAGFFEGTEHVGKALGKPALQGKDGHVIRVDGEERILTGEHNRALPDGMSNADLVEAAQQYKMGNTYDFMPKFRAIETNSNIDLSKVIESNNRVEKAIKNIPPAPEFDLSGFNYWIEKRLTAHGIETYQTVLKKFKGK